MFERCLTGREDIVGRIRLDVSGQGKAVALRSGADRQVGVAVSRRADLEVVDAARGDPRDDAVGIRGRGDADCVCARQAPPSRWRASRADVRRCSPTRDTARRSAAAGRSVCPHRSRGARPAVPRDPRRDRGLWSRRSATSNDRDDPRVFETWVCMSIRPGIRKRPLPSTTCAFGAGGREAVGPTYSMRSPRTRTEPRRGGSSSIDRIVTSRIRSAAGAGEGRVEQPRQATAMTAKPTLGSTRRIGIAEV